MPKTSKPRSAPRAVTRARRSLREHLDRWHSAINAAGRFAAAVGYTTAAAANTHLDDRARLEQEAVALWEIGDRLNEAAIDRAENQQTNSGRKG